MAFTNLDPSLTASTQRDTIVNGGFEVWQRGTSFTAPATLAWTADRWQVNTDESTNVNITQDTVTVDSGVYSLKTVVSSAGASKFYRLRQKFTDEAPGFSNKTVTFTCRVFTSVASAIKIAIGDQSAIQARSSYHTGGGGWETLSVTYTFGASITEVTFFIGMIDAGDKKNGTYYFDSAMAVMGTGAPVFQTEDSALGLVRCQRYFVRLAGNNAGGEFIAAGQNQSTTASYYAVRLPVQMRAAPTVTINNQTGFGVYSAAGAGITCTTLSAGIATIQCLTIVANVAAGLVAGNANILYSASTSSYFDVSADT